MTKRQAVGKVRNYKLQGPTEKDSGVRVAKAVARLEADVQDYLDR